MRKRIHKARRVVVKIGTNVLAGTGPGFDVAVAANLVKEMAADKAAGREFVVVSSGAILAGRRRLSIETPRRSALDITTKQALAAVGQVELMRFWRALFDSYGLPVAQMLVTRDVIDARERFINARHTLAALLDHHVVPIINENDSVATDEIQLGDNDNLSAIAAGVADADVLILLTDIDGLYSDDPAKHRDAALVPFVALEGNGDFRAGDSASGLGLGGMATKVAAARLAARFGVPTIIANGKTPGILARVLAGEEVGTWFEPKDARLKTKKRWLMLLGDPDGALTVDDGAAAALRERGKSLLPKGVTAVRGRFARGAVVEILDAAGRPVARGLCSYSSDEARTVAGLHSAGIEKALGYRVKDEIVHRDDMILMETS